MRSSRSICCENLGVGIWRKCSTLTNLLEMNFAVWKTSTHHSKEVAFAACSYKSQGTLFSDSLLHMVSRLKLPTVYLVLDHLRTFEYFVYAVHAWLYVANIEKVIVVALQLFRQATFCISRIAAQVCEKDRFYIPSKRVELWILLSRMFATAKCSSVLSPVKNITS